MTGKLIHQDQGYWVEHRYPLMDRPISVGTKWLVEGSKRTGPLAPFITEEGLGVTYKQQNTWQASKEGHYLVLYTTNMGERLQDQEIPRPTVKKGIELRWYLGRWEKYTKRDGWITA